MTAQTSGRRFNIWTRRAFIVLHFNAARGEVYRAVAEEGVPYREIAEAIGRQLGMPMNALSVGLPGREKSNVTPR